MKVLLVHSYYVDSGGEDAVFDQENALLSSDVEVSTLKFRNLPGIKGAIQFAFSIWNILASSQLRKKIIASKPDLIHIHNWHFASGPIIIRTAKKLNVPVIMTVHNYRLLCPSATLMDRGKLFLPSVRPNFPWTAVSRKVYRNSYFLTLWLAVIVWFHKVIGTWGMVDKYFFLTGFAKDIFIASKFSLLSDKFYVKPNFFAVPNVENPNIKRQQQFLFVGRLSEEKGIEVLLNAFSSTNHLLHIAGTGPFLDMVQQYATSNTNIIYLGELNKEQVLTQMRVCTALIFPSIWFEGMPMTLIEALSLKTPIIASKIGAMQSMITDKVNGLHFESGNLGDLRIALDNWQSMSQGDRDLYSENAYESFLKYYTPKKNLEMILDIYTNTITTTKSDPNKNPSNTAN